MRRNSAIAGRPWYSCGSGGIRIQASSVSSATTRVDVAALEGVGEAGEQRALGGRVGQGAAARALGRASSAARARCRALLTEASVVVQHLRHLGGAVAEHVAQHQHRPLPGRHPLQAGDEGEPDRLLGLVAGVGAGGAVGQALEQRVGVRLQPDRLAPARRLRRVGRARQRRSRRPAAGRCRAAR